MVDDRRASIVPFEREDGLWDWKLVGVNGEEVCGSLQGFDSEADAVRGARRAQELMVAAELVEPIL